MGHHVEMNLRLLQEQAFLTTEPGDVFLIRVLCVHSCLGCILLYWLNKESIVPGGGGWGKDKIKSEVSSLSSSSPPFLSPFPLSLSLSFPSFVSSFLSLLRQGLPVQLGQPLIFPTALNLICGPDWPFLEVSLLLLSNVGISLLNYKQLLCSRYDFG